MRRYHGTVSRTRRAQISTVYAEDQSGRLEWRRIVFTSRPVLLLVHLVFSTIHPPRRYSLRHGGRRHWLQTTARPAVVDIDAGLKVWICNPRGCCPAHVVKVDMTGSNLVRQIFPDVATGGYGRGRGSSQRHMISTQEEVQLMILTGPTWLSLTSRWQRRFRQRKSKPVPHGAHIKMQIIGSKSLARLSPTSRDGDVVRCIQRKLVRA